MAAVTLAGVCKAYGEKLVVRDVDLDIRDGELMVLVGPSGCGKTTTLRMVAGLEEITRGEMRIGNRLVNHVHPKDRDIAMVFQSYALYPHMTVYENIAFGLRLRGMPESQIDERVRAAAKTLGIDQVVEHVVSRLGNVELALVTGDYAKGIDSGLIDLVLVGRIDKMYFESLAEKIEGIMQRKIRPLFLTREEFLRLKERIVSENALLLWGDEGEIAAK